MGRVVVVVWGLLVLAALAWADEVEILTTNAGAPIDDYRNSWTVSRRGGILLQDAQLIERLQIHNRERIPERNVHARGATAKGRFTLTRDMSDYTIASMFTGSNTTTELACRWSTVIHSVGSPEFLRDPRGFAIKFYTDEGNYDIVGLSFPVFFIRDGIRFPEMIRSLKPNPKTGVQEWWRVWDYFSHYPESLHMFTWLLDDVGIPASYRELDGWGVHTFKWINKQGKSHFVRYYWKSAQGVKSLDDDEAVTKHFSFHTTDLYENVAAGNFPKWTLYVQLIAEENSAFIQSLPFDILDTTKEWPPHLIPMHEVGEIVFDKNVDSQFLENEMIAFSPSRLVPGIEPSDEKMLQTRLFAYADTQRYRLGVNNQMLPINRPKCPFKDAHVDGQMNSLNPSTDTLSSSEVNYFPSEVRPEVREAPAYPHDPAVLNGTKIREMIAKTDDFQQPGDRFRSLDASRQDRFVNRLASTLSGPRLNEKVKQTWLAWWKKVDETLYQKLIKALDLLSASSPSPVRSSLQPRDRADQEVQEMKEFRDAFLRASGSNV